MASLTFAGVQPVPMVRLRLSASTSAFDVPTCSRSTSHSIWPFGIPLDPFSLTFGTARTGRATTRRPWFAAARTLFSAVCARCSAAWGTKIPQLPSDGATSTLWTRRDSHEAIFSASSFAGILTSTDLAIWLCPPHSVRDAEGPAQRPDPPGHRVQFTVRPRADGLVEHVSRGDHVVAHLDPVRAHGSEHEAPAPEDEPQFAQHTLHAPEVRGGLRRVQVLLALQNLPDMRGH